jgi:hypothetical protein
VHSGHCEAQWLYFNERALANIAKPSTGPEPWFLAPAFNETSRRRRRFGSK